MIILCEYCDARCVCYDQWLEHLLTQSHQEITKENISLWISKGNTLKERSVLVSITSSVKPKSSEFCWYFASYGLVSDAYFDPDMEFCVVQLDKRDYAVKALSDNNHEIGGLPVNVRWMVDVTAKEWQDLTTGNVATRLDDPVVPITFSDRHEELAYNLKSLSLDSQLHYLTNKLTMKPEEVVVRQKLLLNFKDILNQDYPLCVLYGYGSSVMGISESSSELDVYVDCLGVTLPNGSPIRKELHPPKRELVEQVIRRLQDLNRTSNFSSDFTPFLDITEPSICFTHQITGVKCRLTFENLLTVKTTNVLSLLMKLDSRIPTLMQIIRYWARYHKLARRTRISSYSLNLLIIVFLTKHKIIPSIDVLQSLCDFSNKRLIAGWDASYCENVEQIINFISSPNGSLKYDKRRATDIPSARSVLELLLKFFEMYAHVDFQSQVLCTLTGEFLPKKYFLRGNESYLPNTLHLYKSWATSGNDKFNVTTTLCIQDPFNLSCNVSANCPNDIVWKFQFRCAETVENIEAVLSSRSPQLFDIFTAPAIEKEESSTTIQGDDRMKSKSFNHVSVHSKTVQLQYNSCIGRETRFKDPPVKQIVQSSPTTSFNVEKSISSKVLEIFSDGKGNYASTSSKRDDEIFAKSSSSLDVETGFKRRKFSSRDGPSDRLIQNQEDITRAPRYSIIHQPLEPKDGNDYGESEKNNSQASLDSQRTSINDRYQSNINTNTGDYDEEIYNSRFWTPVTYRMNKNSEMTRKHNEANEHYW